MRREKFFALLSDDLGQLSDIIHFFASFFAGVCVSKTTGHLEVKSFLQEQFYKHDIFLQRSNARTACQNPGRDVGRDGMRF